jgi:hypothetical protein
LQEVLLKGQLALTNFVTIC